MMVMTVMPERRLRVHGAILVKPRAPCQGSGPPMARFPVFGKAESADR